MEKFKKELKDALTTLYPDYEKEIYQIMSRSDAETLSTLFAQYPDLKYNAVLEQYTDKISGCLDDIARSEHAINRKMSRIRYNNNSSWVMSPPEIPKWIEDLDASLITTEEQPG